MYFNNKTTYYKFDYRYVIPPAIVKLLSSVVPVSQRVPQSVDPGAEPLHKRTRGLVTWRHEEVTFPRVVHLTHGINMM